MDLRMRLWPVVLATILGAPLAHAATGQDVATAQALFEEGKRLMKDGKLADACPKLAESQRLDPASGTLLALALCHEQEGKTATAWAEFSQVLSDARKDRRADREQAAQQHLGALERRLTRVNVIVSVDVTGLEVRRDGTLIGKPQWRVPLPIDPGDHTFEASAPGKKAWRAMVNVQGEGKTVDVTVPKLDESAAEALPVAPPPAASPSTAAPSSHAGATPMTLPPDAGASGDGSTQRTLALVAGGVGIVAVGVGSVFGFRARSLWSDAKNACPSDRCTTQDGVTKAHDAGSAADLSSIFFVAGAAGVVAGALLFFSAPSGRAAPTTQGVRITPTLGGLSVSGTL